MSKTGLIIQREYGSRVRKKSFLIITLLVPLIIAGLGFLAMWLSVQETKQVKVLVADPENLCNGKIFVGDNANPPAIFYFYEDYLEPSVFYESGQYDDYDILIGIRKEVITNKSIKVFYRERMSKQTEYYIRDRIELRLEEYFAMDRGITLTEYRRIRQEFNFILENVDPYKTDTEPAQIVGFAISILIFIFILTYAGQVMRGVIEEKTSRVVEIVISSVKPIQLMMGKIIGIGLVGLTQFAIWAVIIGLGLTFIRIFFFQDMVDPSNLADALAPIEGMSPDLLTDQAAAVTRESDLIWIIYNGIPWPTLITLFVLYFMGGYLLYGALFAMIGAAVDSETDSQQVMIPVMLPLMFSYFIGILVIANPNGPAAAWFSQIPFSSPIIMLQLVAADTIEIWQVVLSLTILAGTIILIIWGAAKVYRTGILMYGKKASWKEIFKWMRH